MRWIVPLVPLALVAPLSLLMAFQLPQGLKSQPLPLPGGAAQKAAQRDAEAVRFLPQQIRVQARHPAVVDLHFHVADGLHINSHVPREKTLIATRLAVLEGNGINVTAVDFPPGANYVPPFSPHDKLSVYSGDFVLRAHLIVEPGEHLLKAELRYQACDSNSCMPPRDLPITASVLAQ